MNQLIPCTGHATIGGLGPVSRLWGSALDHILEVEVVLANSTITRASEVLNPDVFFVRVSLPSTSCLTPSCDRQALKGAAASFGIITEFVVRTQPKPSVTTQYSYNVQLRYTQFQRLDLVTPTPAGSASMLIWLLLSLSGKP